MSSNWLKIIVINAYAFWSQLAFLVFERQTETVYNHMMGLVFWTILLDHQHTIQLYILYKTAIEMNVYMWRRWRGYVLITFLVFYLLFGICNQLKPVTIYHCSMVLLELQIYCFWSYLLSTYKWIFLIKL